MAEHRDTMMPESIFPEFPVNAPMPAGTKPPRSDDVWLVVSLLPDRGPGDWEINGAFSGLDLALAHCTDGKSAAVHMKLDYDYRDCTEFWQATPARPEPFLVTADTPDDVRFG